MAAEASMRTVSRAPSVAVPPGHGAYPTWTVVPLQLRDSVIAALQLMAQRAESGTLDLVTATDALLAVVLEESDVRFLLTVELRVATSALSPREQQIARMVADGSTNAAIATSLEISRWTVSTHLRRIFAKVGVGSRAEMVAQLFGAPHLPALATAPDGAAPGMEQPVG